MIHYYYCCCCFSSSYLAWAWACKAALDMRIIIWTAAFEPEKSVRAVSADTEAEIIGTRGLEKIRDQRPAFLGHGGERSLGHQDCGESGGGDG